MYDHHRGRDWDRRPPTPALGLTVVATGLVFGFWPLLLGGGVVILAAAGRAG